MGAVAAMTPAYRTAFLAGWADSTCAHGADSLRAYAASVGGDPQALIDATTAAAADLGWGRWNLHLDAASDALRLTVEGSPFVAGWQAAAADASASEAVCAPIRGMLQALAQALFDGPVQVTETSCAACAAGAGSAAGAPSATCGAAASETSPSTTVCQFVATRIRP
jgi:hypothetical protein